MKAILKVGDKAQGFKFKDCTDGVSYNGNKDKYIGKVGKVEFIGKLGFSIKFEDCTWMYPISLIHLAVVETLDDIKFINQLDRNWQKVVDFVVGDIVEFSIPYFEGKFNYNGKVLELKDSYAVVEYYEPLYDIILISHISLLDANGYRRLTKQRG